MPWLSTLSHKVLLAIAYGNATIVVAHLLAIQVVYLRIVAMCNLNAFYGIGIRIIILDTHGDIIDVGYRGCVAALYEYLYLISLGNHHVVAEGGGGVGRDNFCALAVVAGDDGP